MKYHTRSKHKSRVSRKSRYSRDKTQKNHHSKIQKKVYKKRGGKYFVDYSQPIAPLSTQQIEDYVLRAQHKEGGGFYYPPAPIPGPYRS